MSTILYVVLLLSGIGEGGIKVSGEGDGGIKASVEAESSEPIALLLSYIVEHFLWLDQIYPGRGFAEDAAWWLEFERQLGWKLP